MYKNLIPIALVAFAAVGCSNVDEPKVMVGNLTQSCNEEVMTNEVSFSSVESLASSMVVESRSEGAVSKLSCFINTNKDTVFYVIDRPGGGWTLYATDKRISPIVASSENGTFKEALNNSNFKYWVDYMGQKMQVVKKLPDSQLNLASEDIQANRIYWETIENPMRSPQLRDSVTLSWIITWEVLQQFGHFELASSSGEEVVVDQIPRLTKTNWYQDFLTNEACPYRVTLDGRCHAGCVAIAGAQMLYFLHNKFGVPTHAPSQAYCNSKYNEKPYDWAQTEYTEEIWDQIRPNGKNAAPLVADIGRRINMAYGEQASYANTADLPAKVFAPYGISCARKDYNETDLCQSLMSGMPVIISAGDMNNMLSRHAFICDRYQRTKRVYTRVYRWVYDSYPVNGDGTSVIVPDIPDKIEVTETLPQVSAIGFNWGEGPVYNSESEWFALSGPWTNENLSITADYRHNAYMIVDFKVAQ